MINNGVLKRYSHNTEGYDKYRIVPPDDLLFSLIKLSKKNKPSYVVDLGCGTGLSTRIWADHADKIIGVDPSEDMIKEAKKHTIQNNINYIINYANKTNVEDNVADIVTASASIHWMDPETTLVEITRITRKGGVFAAYGNRYPLFLSSVELHSMYKEFRVKLDALEKVVHHNKDFTKYRWDTIASIYSNSNKFSFFSEFYFHSIENWSYHQFVGWLNTLGGIRILMNSGYSSDKIGLEKLLEKSKKIFGKSKIPVLFNFRTLIGTLK